MKRRFLVLLSLLLPVFAYAADAMGPVFNILNPPPVKNATDLSIGYLGNIFGVVDGVLHGGGSQIMGQMFGVFNAGALVLGGIIIIYTMLVSTLKTAHEGEVLGQKWSSIWIPVRSVLGIALLIPKATGYSIIQIFMMWVIVQGVGLADSIWARALDYLSVGGVIVQQTLDPNPGGKTGKLKALTQRVFLSEVCLYGLQNALNKAHQQLLKTQTTPVPPVPNLVATVFPMPKCTTDTCSVQVPGKPVAFAGSGSNYNWGSLAGACGTISWSYKARGNPSTISGGSIAPNKMKQFNAIMRQAQQVAVQQVFLDMSGPAQRYVTNNTLSTPAPQITTYLEPKMFMDAAEDFEGILYPAAKSFTSWFETSASRAVLQGAYSQGWIMAGSWYWSLVQMNSDAAIGTNYKNAIPTRLPQVNTNTNSPQYSVVGSYSAYASANLKKILEPVVGANTAVKDSTLKQCAENGTNCANLGEFIGQANYFIDKAHSTYQGRSPLPPLVSYDVGSSSALGAIELVLGPLVSGIVKISAGFTALATSQVLNNNPLLAIATIGQGLMELVVNVWIAASLSLAAVTGALGAIPSITASSSMIAAISWFTPFITAIMGVMFTEGAVLTYYLPLIPYILFTFGAIGWLIATIEAMVAAPLVALGITHPEGAEVLGKADPAVLLLVNVFMRPSMMIIGFIAGIILSYVGLWLVNAGFWRMWGTMMGLVFNPAQSWITFALSFPMVLLIYISLVIPLMNLCFGLVNVVPDKVMRWIGGTMEGVAGEVAKMQGEAQQGFKGGAQAFGTGAGEAAKKSGERADKKGKGKSEGSGGDDKSSNVGSDSSGSKKKPALGT